MRLRSAREVGRKSCEGERETRGNTRVVETLKWRSEPSLISMYMSSPGCTSLRRANAAKTCASRTALPLCPGRGPYLYHPTAFDEPLGTSASPFSFMPTCWIGESTRAAGMRTCTGIIFPCWTIFSGFLVGEALGLRCSGSAETVTFWTTLEEA